MKKQQSYIHALRFAQLNAVYDPLIQIGLQEATFKRRLIDQAKIGSGQRVLDVGSGTGTLALLIKHLYPDAEVVGLDGDPDMVSRAQHKAATDQTDVTFTVGLSFALPYPDASFDRVFSSLMFHHLSRDHKERTLQEMRRVLRPGGEAHIADWGKPQNLLMQAAFLWVRLLDGFETTAENAKGQLPDLMARSGFERVRQTDSFMTVAGTLTLYTAYKPEG